MNLKGKVTVIVGGEGPLGREVSKKFLAEGAKVFIGWYAEKEWEEAKGLLSAYKGQYRRDAGGRNQGRSGSKTDAEGKRHIWIPRCSASHGGYGAHRADGLGNRRCDSGSADRYKPEERFSLRKACDSDHVREEERTHCLFPCEGGRGAPATFRCLCCVQSRADHTHASASRRVERHSDYRK